MFPAFHSMEPSHLSLSRPFAYGSSTSHSPDEHDRNMRMPSNEKRNVDNLKRSGRRVDLSKRLAPFHFRLGYIPFLVRPIYTLWVIRRFAAFATPRFLQPLLPGLAGFVCRAPRARNT